jgi:hypothetical protein
VRLKFTLTIRLDYVEATRHLLGDSTKIPYVNSPSFLNTLALRVEHRVRVLKQIFWYNGEQVGEAKENRAKKVL